MNKVTLEYSNAPFRGFLRKFARGLFIVSGSEEAIRISTVLNFSEIPKPPADLIVLPEYCEYAHIHRAASDFPESIVVGSSKVNGNSVGFLFHRGQNHINYEKIGKDGHTTGGGSEKQCPVYETDEIVVGVVICMDIQKSEFVRNLAKAVKASSAKFKFICLPGDMGYQWFPGDQIGSDETLGIRFVLSNNNKGHQGFSRRRGFITGPDNRFVLSQREKEPLDYEIPDP